MGPKANNTCQDDQICVVLKAVIDGAVHGAKYIWDAKLSTKGWYFLLVDAKNAFNELNHIGMLWTVSIYVHPELVFFHCYRQWSSLVLCNGNGTASSLDSREVMIQGVPLVTVAYGIGVLQLIKNWKRCILMSLGSGTLMMQEILVHMSKLSYILIF